MRISRGSSSYNLLDQGFLLRILADPTLIRKEVEAKKLRNAVVFIDEIQKCPALMDEVHLMIEEYGIRFLLTGSSARKLKKSGANLLGGRGRDRTFHPLVSRELGAEHFDLDRALNNGLIPTHYFSDETDEDLASYVGRLEGGIEIMPWQDFLDELWGHAFRLNP